jgi:hypothetical protein
MKLDLWEAIFSLLDAGGIFQNGRYEIRNSKGHLHRDGGPAAIYPDGRQYWYQNGKFHREDGPALTYPDGRRYWYWNGALVDERIGEGYRQSGSTGKVK